MKRSYMWIMGAIFISYAIVSATETKNAIPGNREIVITDEGEVASDALWLTRYAFGPGLNAKSNTILVYRGYIFVAWYQGGMDNRAVILSRKKIGDKKWRHITFPHRHVMFRRDKHLPENQRRGDSHNTIAIGICPKDDTVHLIYDLHAYRPQDFKHDYFNYSVSTKGGATASDEKWQLKLFAPKRTHLNPKAPKSAYYQITYPRFRVDDNGYLHVGWRQGGTNNAEQQFSTYDGKKWTPPTSWNKPAKGNKKGFYGGFKVFNDKMYVVGHAVVPKTRRLVSCPWPIFGLLQGSERNLILVYDEWQKI